MAWGGEFFSSDIIWWLGDWTRLILHQLPLPRKSLKRGKDILVSTSWWEVANHIRYGIRFTVRILGGITHYLSLIPLTLERSKDRLFWNAPSPVTQREQLTTCGFARWSVQ